MLWGLFATRAATGTEAGGGRLLHPSFVDLASVSVSARLMGALAGGHLEAQPVRVARLDRCLRQVRAAGPAAVPRHKGVVHLCNQIHAKILAQGYDHILLKSTAKLSTMMLSYIKDHSAFPRHSDDRSKVVCEADQLSCLGPSVWGFPGSCSPRCALRPGRSSSSNRAQPASCANRAVRSAG